MLTDPDNETYMKPSGDSSLKGNLFFLDQDQQAFSESQIELLTAIDDCGSITRAAKRVGISYKTAWDRIDNMNNLSDQPLVRRSAGGARGGGTMLTDLGREIVAGFNALKGEHDAFVNRLGDSLHSVGDIVNFLKDNTLRTSARNQYRGIISRISRGGVNAEVELRIADSIPLTALITNDSLKRMGFRKNGSAVALIKSSWVLLSKDLNLQTSARNSLTGKIVKIIKGQVNSEVILDLGDEKSICAIVTNKSVTELKLRKGDQACAFFKASSVILMAG